MEIYNKPFLRIEYIPEKQMLIQKWRGFCTSEQFREGVLKGFDNDEYPIYRVLTDTQEQEVVRKEDTDWVSQEIIPKAIAKGMIAQALVLPESVFTKLSVENFNKTLPNNFQIRYFASVEEGIKWLESVL